MCFHWIFQVFIFGEMVFVYLGWWCLFIWGGGVCCFVLAFVVIVVGVDCCSFFVFVFCFVCFLVFD